MFARQAVLLTLPSGSRAAWSYLHTDTLLPLISFVSHSFENTGDVEVFFPFWNSSLATGSRHSRHREGKLVTATPLEPAPTNCDARKSFGICSCENAGCHHIALAKPNGIFATYR